MMMIVEWLIPNAYLYFSETFDDWLGTAGTETFAKKLEALYYSLKDDVHLVVIDLEREDDAQEIFETLNALGTPLLPADLVKNYLFHLANRQKLDTRKLYDTYWKAFDDDRAYWRKEVRQGRLKRPQLDLFLNHFLTLMLGEEVLIAQVFSRYREYVEDRDPRSSSDHMVIFRGYADVYRKFDEFEADSREGLFFYRLEQLDTTTFFPILLEALKRFDSESGRNELHQILGDLESFFVRRTICDLTTKGYNKLTVEMIKEFKKESGGISGAAVRQFLLRQNSDTGRWPNDEELRKSWNSSPIYKAVKRSKVRMILEALEAGLHSGKTERIKIDRKLTIEHLLPRDWEAHWPLPPGTNQELMEDAREAAIHVVGNLSLLTRELNPSVSNGPWQRKRAEILKHSALNLNRTLPELWSEEAIHARSRELFEIAVKVWPFPPQSDHSLKPVGTETASSLK